MRQNLYITCAALALVFIAALASRFILFPSNVGLLGVIEPNHVVLGKTVLNKTTLEVYASYDYDCAVLGITVLTPDSEPRYLPLYGSTSCQHAGALKCVVITSSAQSQTLFVLASWVHRC